MSMESITCCRSGDLENNAYGEAGSILVHY